MNPAPSPGELLHEDPSLLVVAKPEGISAIPERDLQIPSVQRLLEAQRGERLWVVHRLDKEVSGALLFARTPDAHRALSLAFERREVEKSYTIATHGRIAADEGALDRPILQFGSGRMGIDDRRGKPSLTRFRVLQRSGKYTLLDASPHTGRRHQLRVHFYAEGHPIVGDLRYGERGLQATFPRLMLHARRLRVPHPGGGHLAIEAPLPAGFLASLAALGLSPG
ncbi:MAG: RluA family pseudouridine synthase [Polyangiaceae bacterium]|jgi:RluA family pseudouridine synthase|nr:RluA family pseudouridine synthase [Polyangiaceae bacterium]